jgi:Domain of unknown function (DUF4062)/NACHT domain
MCAMSVNWQTVRVFISSTFRDMHAERDHLVKVVFPALRERLEKHRVYLVDIDLRWGVTKEQADNDQALDVCLDQIYACRPFFIGILGERYGWVSTKLPGHVAGKYDWVRHHSGKSITELEMLYGVLNKPQMHNHAYFCFRDPKFLHDVPCELLRVFGEFPTDDELRDLPPKAARKCAVDRRRKLRSLKQTIRDANLPTPPFENYPCQFAGWRINRRLARRELSKAEQDALEQVTADGVVWPDEFRAIDQRLQAIVSRIGTATLSGLHEFGQRIHDWLWQAIKAELKLEEQPSPTAETDSLAEERDFHDRFMESRLRVYVGRKDVRNELARYADGDDKFPCVVTGGSGSGKSAALARFVRVYERARRGTLVIPHFIGASPRSTNLRDMLRRFCQVLKTHFGFADDVPEETAKLSVTFREFIGKVPADTRVLLVIDALNQLDEADRAQELYWLPTELPPQVKVIVSCIDPVATSFQLVDSEPSSIIVGRDSKPSEKTDGLESHPTEEKRQPVLEAFRRRKHVAVQVAALSAAEQREIIRQVPSLSAKTLDDVQVRLLLSNPATANPLFLLVALEELRGFAPYERLNERIAAFPHEGDTVTAIFTQVIERLEKEFDQETVHAVLTLLASARRGLSERELQELLVSSNRQSAIENLQSSDLFPVLRQLRPYLLSRAGLIDFYHRNLFKAVREHYLGSEKEQRQAHGRLAEYFKLLADPLKDDSWRDGIIRGMEELPYHLANSDQMPLVADVLTDLRFLDSRCERTGPHPLLADYALLSQGSPVASTTDTEMMHAFVRRHLQALGTYPDSLFSLAHHEGPPAAQAAARELIRRGLWRKPWVRITSQQLPQAASEPAGSVEFDIAWQHKFESSCAADLSNTRRLVFRVKRLGQVAVLDLARREDFPYTIAIRRLRPVGLFVSEDARLMVVPFDNGEADILRLVGPNGLAPTHAEPLATVSYQVPEMDPPVLLWRGERLFYQRQNGVVGFWRADQDFDPRKAVSGELAGAIPIGDRLVVLVRGDASAGILVLFPDGTSSAFSQPGARPMCLCGLGELQVAVAWSDRTVRIYDLVPHLVEQRTIPLDENACRIASDGERLLWVSSRGHWFAGPADATSPPVRIGKDGALFPRGVQFIVSRLEGQVGGRYVVLANAQAAEFRLAEGAVRLLPLKGLFETPSEQVLAIQQRDDGWWLLDEQTGRQTRLTAASEAARRPALGTDGERVLLAAHGPGGQSFLLDLASGGTHPCPEVPQAIDSVVAGSPGGFWLCDRADQIYRVDHHGRCRLVAEVPLIQPGAGQLLCRGHKLFWFGQCFVASAAGTDRVPAFAFYRCRGDQLELLGCRVFSKQDGNIDVWDYTPTSNRLLAVGFAPVEGHHTVRFDSPEKFIRGEEQALIAAGLEVTSATSRKIRVIRARLQEVSRLVVLSNTGAVLWLDLNNRCRLAALQPSIPFSEFAEGTNSTSSVLMVEGGTRAVRCYLEEPKCL